MSLKITNTAAAYSNTYPVYGHIADQDNLKVALRATGYSNLVDLSPREGVFSVNPSVVLTEYGPRSLSNATAIRSDYQEQDDSFTALCTFKVDKGTRSGLSGADQYKAYAHGSYAGTLAAGGGMGVLVQSIANASVPDTFDLDVRFILRIKNKSTGSYGLIILIVKLFTAQAVLPNTTDWLYTSVSFNHTTGFSVIKLLNKDMEVSNTFSPAVWFTDAQTRGTVFDATGLPLYHHVGSAPSAFSGVERNEVYVPEFMLYGNVLSDVTILKQYEASKKWLLAARGITLE